jgi:hypothetical protein
MRFVEGLEPSETIGMVPRGLIAKLCEDGCGPAVTPTETGAVGAGIIGIGALVMCTFCGSAYDRLAVNMVMSAAAS